MANVDKVNKMNEPAKRLAEANRDAAHTVVDHVFGIQERNIRFAQGVVDSASRELREQAESNRAVVEELVEKAENQRGAFQTVVQESMNAYGDLLFAPLSYYKEGLETLRKAS